jgi:hypothetical protein
LTSEDQQRVARLLREGPCAPPELERRVAAQIAHARARRLIQLELTRRRLALACGLAAVLALLALILPAVGGGIPTRRRGRRAG